MGRKVFISFLGTNNYVECRYKFNEAVSEPVRFVQEALIAQLCKDWTEKDRILIFCTSLETTGNRGSKEINWFDNQLDNSEIIGLKRRLEELRNNTNIKPSVEEFDIVPGFSEEEIWSVFNAVYHQLKPADEIYFDVTHAFRSIPLFSVVLFNYSKYMIGTQLRTIMYGAFEKLGSTAEVRKMSVDKRVVPIIDLTNIARLQEYNQIASGLKNFGKIKPLESVINKSITSDSEKVISELGASISELDEYINTIDLKKIKKGLYIKKFRLNYRRVKGRNSFVSPINRILDELYKETEDFVDEDSFQNIEVAINWTIKHDMLMQAFPLAEEYILLNLANMLKEFKPRSFSSKEYREFISGILGMSDEDFTTRNWKYTLADYPDVADKISDDFLIIELRPLYDKIRRARNSLAHGNGSISYEDLKKLIPIIIDSVEHLNAAYTNYPSTQYIIKNLC